MANQIGTVPFASNRNPFNYEKIEQVTRDIQTQWLTFEEITEQLNLYGDESQDDLLSQLEVATRMHIEDYLGKPIFPITFRVYYGNQWQYNSPANLDLPETSMVQTVINAVRYYNSDNVLVTLTANNYFYDQTGNRVVVSGVFPSNVSKAYVASESPPMTRSVNIRHWVPKAEILPSCEKSSIKTVFSCSRTLFIERSG